MRSNLYSFISFFVLFPLALTAQKNVNVERSSLLKTFPENKDAKVVASSYLSEYRFLLTGEKVTIENEDKQELISLEGNLDHVTNIFYNNRLTVNSFTAFNKGGKSLKPKTVCGNYEVDGIFYSDSKVCSYGMNFLYEGSEIIWQAKTTYDDPRYLSLVFFHDEVPVESRELTFEIPSGIKVELVERNFDGFKIAKTKSEVGNKVIYKYKVERLPVRKTEEYSLGTLYSYPHIVVLTKGYTSRSGEKNILSSVDDLYDWYRQLVSGISDNPSTLKPEVDRLIASAKNDEDRIKSIYYWVQDNIKYIAFEDGIAGFKPDASQNVYNNRFGDCKGMANLTKQMLKLAGYDARLAWIGTKRIPFSYDIPSLSVDNHMVCAVKIGETFSVLDATEKYIGFGKNAERIQGKQMLIEDGPKFILYEVPKVGEEGNLVVRSETLMLENEMLSGSGELQMHGETKKQVLYFSNNVKNEDQERLFRALAIPKHANTDKVEITQVPDVDRDLPLNMKYKYSLGNRVSKFNNDIYIDLDWLKTYQNLKMEEDRVSDLYFHQKVKNRVFKKFKIPTGYSVSHLPHGMDKSFDDFTIRVSFNQVGDEIHYTNEVIIPDGLVKKGRFQVWNQCIKELREIYEDRVVVTKNK